MRAIAKLGIALGALAIGFATYAAVALHRANMAGTQIRNFIQLQVHVRALEAYRSEVGTYPKDLRSVIASEKAPFGDRRYLNGLDYWDHPMRYTTDGAHFLLISLGRDGRADGRPIPSIGTPAPVDKTPCENNTLDTVVSEAGLLRGCAK